MIPDKRRIIARAPRLNVSFRLIEDFLSDFLFQNFGIIQNKINTIYKYFNALQLKYANAITCHKSQGGQWKCVFIDNPFWQEDITVDDLKWLYTAMTRATEKVYLVNFRDELFAE